MASVLDYLAQAAPSQEDYLASNPLFSAGRGISQIQLQPTTNSEAIWQPLLQGLLAGGLGGFGQRQARDSQFQDTKASPFIASQLKDPAALEVNPSLKAYLSESAPESWSPRQAKTDMLSALLTQQNMQDQQAKKADQQAALELELNKLRDPRIIAAKALPSELQTTSDLSQSLQFVDKAIESAKAQNNNGKAIIGGLTQSIPFIGAPNSAKSTIDAVGEAMIGQVDKIQGRETNSDARTRLINQFGPKWYDSDADMERKGAAFKEYLSSLAKSTPINSTSPTAGKSIESAPVETGEITKSGKKVYIVNGVKGTID
jgi:hypothetical protein